MYERDDSNTSAGYQTPRPRASRRMHAWLIKRSVTPVEIPLLAQPWWDYSLPVNNDRSVQHQK